MATVTLCCVVLLSSVGCDPKEDGSKEQGEGSRSSDMAGCHVKPNNPHQSGQPPAKRGEIVGKVQFWCDNPVDRVVGSARLQRKEGRRWVTVRNAVGRRPVRNPEKGKRYVTQGAGSCHEGTYRTAGFGYALRDGKLYEMKSWIYSQTVTDPCGAR